MPDSTAWFTWLGVSVTSTAPRLLVLDTPNHRRSARKPQVPANPRMPTPALPPNRVFVWLVVVNNAVPPGVMKGVSILDTSEMPPIPPETYGINCSPPPRGYAAIALAI